MKFSNVSLCSTPERWIETTNSAAVVAVSSGPDSSVSRQLSWRPTIVGTRYSSTGTVLYSRNRLLNATDVQTPSQSQISPTKPHLRSLFKSIDSTVILIACLLSDWEWHQIIKLARTTQGIATAKGDGAMMTQTTSLGVLLQQIVLAKAN